MQVVDATDHTGGGEPVMVWCGLRCRMGLHSGLLEAKDVVMPEAGGRLGGGRARSHSWVMDTGEVATLPVPMPALVPRVSELPWGACCQVWDIMPGMVGRQQRRAVGRLLTLPLGPSLHAPYPPPTRPSPSHALLSFPCSAPPHAPFLLLSHAQDDTRMGVQYQGQAVRLARAVAHAAQGGMVLLTEDMWVGPMGQAWSETEGCA